MGFVASSIAVVNFSAYIAILPYQHIGQGVAAELSSSTQLACIILRDPLHRDVKGHGFCYVLSLRRNLFKDLEWILFQAVRFI